MHLDHSLSGRKNPFGELVRAGPSTCNVSDLGSLLGLGNNLTCLDDASRQRQLGNMKHNEGGFAPSSHLWLVCRSTFHVATGLWRVSLASAPDTACQLLSIIENQ